MKRNVGQPCKLAQSIDLDVLLIYMYIQFQSLNPSGHYNISNQKEHISAKFSMLPMYTNMLNDNTKNKKASLLYQLIKACHLTKGNQALHNCLILLQTLTAQRTKIIDWTIAFYPVLSCGILSMINSFGFYPTFSPKITKK